MKKIVKLFLIIVFVILVIIIFKLLCDGYQKNKHNNILWLSNNISLVKNDEGIYEVNMKEKISIFNLNYQNVIEEKIEKLKTRENYSIENPLIIYNPYGTGMQSYYIYLGKSYKNLNYKISTDGYSDYQNNLGSKKEYQLIGFIPGMKNTLTLTSGKYKKKINITTPENKNVDIKLETTGSSEKLTNGLYTVLGHDKNYASNIYLYDNEGILRNELVLDSYRADRIIFKDNYMYYPYSKKGIIKVNSLGKIEKIYNLGNYSMHHDMVLDDNNLSILVNEDNKNTIEDVVITLNLKTGKINKVLDMKNLLSELYEKAVNPGKNSYGGKALDWIHLNSISIKGNDAILSSRELSMIIYVSNYQTNPKIKYILADEAMVEGTSYSKLLYSKTSNFTSQAGQHAVSYVEGDDEYYLTMFNNNFGNITTRKDISWSNFPNIGTYTTGETSYFYKYKVNEKNKTYTLVTSIKVPYSSIVSDVQLYEENIIVGSGKDNSFGEYDSDGNLIKQFKYNAKKYAYRVFKYSFDFLNK